MTTAVRDSTLVAASSGTGTNGDTPAGTTAGDIVLGFGHINNNPTWVDNNGANAFTKDLAYEPATNEALHVWSIRATSGNITGWGGTPDFTAGSSTRWSKSMVAISDPDPSVIWDVTPSTSHGQSDSTGSSTTVTVSSLTATTDCILFILIGADGSGTAITTTSMTSQGFTVHENGGNQGQCLISKTVSAGATGTFSFTSAVPAATQWISMPFLIRMASSGVTSTVDATLAGFAGAATVVQTETSSVAAEWIGFTGAATVVQTESCSVAASWAGFTCAAIVSPDGIQPVVASVAAEWSGFVCAAGTVGQALSCSVAASWAGFTAAATVASASPVTSTVAASWGGFTASAGVAVDDGGGGGGTGGARRRSRRRYRGYTPQ